PPPLAEGTRNTATSRRRTSFQGRTRPTLAPSPVRVGRVTWLIVLVAIVLVLAIAVVVVYNRLVRLRNRTENSWAQIDVQLRRRHDLIPNLVEAVKGYMAHERGIFDEIAKARSQAMAAGA